MIFQDRNGCVRRGKKTDIKPKKKKRLRIKKEKRGKRTPLWFSLQQQRLSGFKKKLLASRPVWELIFENKLKEANIKFTAQKGFITPQRLYIADFYIPSRKTVVEIDGGYHKHPLQIWKDKKRDEFFAKRKCHTIRINNEDVKGFDVSIFLKKNI